MSELCKKCNGTGRAVEIDFDFDSAKMVTKIVQCKECTDINGFSTSIVERNRQYTETIKQAQKALREEQ